MIINTIGFLKRLDNVFLKKILLELSRLSRLCKEKKIILKEMEKHLSRKEKRTELILEHKLLMAVVLDKLLLEKLTLLQDKVQLQRKDLQEVVQDKINQLMEEIHKEDGQRVNFQLPCSSSKQKMIPPTVSMVQEPRLDKAHQEIIGKKLVELSELHQILNNITRFLNQKLQQQMQEIDSESI